MIQSLYNEEKTLKSRIQELENSNLEDKEKQISLLKSELYRVRCEINYEETGEHFGGELLYQ